MVKSYQQIQAQLVALQKEADAAKKREIQKVVRDIKESIALYGLTAEDLGLTGDVGTPARAKRKASVTRVEVAKTKAKAPKARQPAAAKKTPPKKRSSKGSVPTGFADGEGNTWSGRGPRPKWFKDAVAQGKTPEDLRA